MWISELSERAGVPVDTIKHYLRIGVLPRGRVVGPQRAEYDDSHVERLRLITAMTDVGDLKLDAVRDIFACFEEADGSLRKAVGGAHWQLSRRSLDSKVPSAEARAFVDELIERQEWQIEPESVHRLALAASLDTLLETGGLLEIAGLRLGDLLAEYAAEMNRIAQFELSFVDMSDVDLAARTVVIGTVLTDPVLILLRRLAHEHVSLRWEENAAAPPEAAG